MYEVIHPFKDLTDNEYKYVPGDKFPREGKKVTKKRIEELSTTKNRLKMPLIKAVEPSDDEKSVQKDETPKKPVKSRKKAE